MRRVEFKTLFLKAANGEKKAAGVTFIELMIAMMLFTLLMWPLYQIFQWSANSTMKTGDLTIAANVASELIELLKNKPFDVLSRLDPKSGLKAKMDEKDIQDFLGKTFDDKFSTTAGRFIRSVEITPTKPIKTSRGDDFAYVQIVVSVYWTERTGTQKGPKKLFALVANENAPLITQ
ncbi:MAG: hypothetical protein BWY32_01749 [bacterium ADurb.Bin243]|nr:MAG: hypothetical protein BWY32_01749 [bacterium ADurb.Bin243]